jgi:phosphatidylserine/phosphatidylglycerophosphate/cardiolipin synthase-like enzyme
LIASFLSKISEPLISAKQDLDQPNYWTSNPSSLLTTSNIHSVALGTGNRILETLLPALESTESEVLFVTCYWAQSDSLNRIADSLRKLSARNLASPKNSKTRVRICFSSSGVWQKLSHPQSRQGRTYSPSEWSKTLGLPGPGELQGVDLQVKSVFFLPISIIHPKFVVIDRKLAFLPSCNVSWEEWFEGCVELSGPVVQQFVRFWEEFWADGEDHGRLLTSTTSGSEETARLPSLSASPSPSLLTYLSHSQLPRTQTTTLFLPSPHHRDPNFHPLPFQSHPNPPPTPLNTLLLLAFASARRSIQIQTPNLTSQPAIEALLAALARGVEVRITTSENLQRIEQIVTAGTTTGRCVGQLVNGYGALVEERRRKSDGSLEEALPGVGRLSVSYYQPSRSRSRSQGQVGDSQDGNPRGDGQVDEPVQSHFKLTVIDGEVAVFGSGNLDRASWFTSQELGLAFFGNEFVGRIEEGLEGAMKGRRKMFFEA